MPVSHRNNSILPPKKQPHMTESVLLGEREVPGIPPNPLPTWVTLPMESKLPMLPGPKGAVVLYTTNLGEKIHKSSRDLGFDLTDPYAMLLSNNYKPLHDPHLKPHLTGPIMKKRLQRSGFITNDGKVLCTLREFNEYRQYLRKISLRQEKQAEEEEAGTQRKHKRPYRDTYGAKMARMKEEKVREIKKRLEKQHEEDRKRYARLLDEVEERRMRLREEQMNRLSQKENIHKQQRDKRNADIRRRYHEDRMRKLGQLQMWLEEDRKRMRRAEQRRKLKELERQKKLEESWNLRKRMQRLRLEQEAKIRQREEDIKKKSIEQREKLLKKQRERQQSILIRMTNQRRREKEQLAAAYSRKFEERLRKRRAKATKKKHKKPKIPPRRRSPFKSVWDLEKSIMDTFPPHAEHLPTVKASAEYEFLQVIEEHLREQEQQRELHQNLSQLGLADFRGALFSPEVVRKVSQELSPPSVEELQQRVSQLGLADFRGATFTPAIVQADEEELEVQDSMVFYRYEQPRDREEDMRDVAKYIVDITLELASKVVYPAYMRFLEENQPDLFSQFYRPITPQPQLEDTFDESLEEEEYEDVTAYKRSGVRFSMVEENITFDGEIPIWEEEDWMMAGDEDYEDEEFEDEEDLHKKSSLLAKVTGRDSITKLHDAQGTEQIQDLDALLGRIMGLLSSGGLDRQQMRRLAEFAKEIIDALDLSTLASPIKSPDIPPVSLSPVPEPVAQRSTTSELAEQVVEETVNKIYEMLFKNVDVMEPVPHLQWDKTKPMSTSSVSALADVLTSEAISRATDSLEELTVEARTPLRTASSDEAGRVVTDTLQRVSRGMKPQPCSMQQKPKSMTSMLVMETINKVAEELSHEHETEIGRTASLIVQQTLEKVAAQVQETSRRSSTSLFIQDVLGKVADEIEEQKMATALNWDRHKPLKSKEACGSLTSMLVRDALSKVIHEIEEDSKQKGPVTKSASSAFAEELVTDTLTKCLHDVKSGQMDRSQVIGFVGAALNSAKTLTWKSISTPASTQSLGALRTDSRFKSTNSLLVEALVRETLVQVKQDICAGQISERELNELQNSIQFAERSSSRTRLGTRESLEAEGLVMKAIGNVLDDLGVGTIQFEDEPRSGPSSRKQSDKKLAATSSSDTKPVKKKSTLQKISDAVFGVFKRSSSSNLKPKSTESEQAELIVADVIANVGSEVKTTPQLSWNELSSKPQISVNDSMVTEDPFAQTVIVLDHDESDTDSEPSMEIHPIVHGEEIHVDPHLVGDALAAFSSREVETLKNPCDPTAHYSYRDIFHPDISRVAILHTDSEESLKHQFMNVSHRNIVLHSHLPDDELEHALEEEEEIDKGHQHEKQVRLELEEDLEGVEPIDSVVSVVEIHSGGSEESKRASKTQSLGSTSSGKASSGQKLAKTASTGVIKKSSSANERQRLQMTTSQKTMPVSTASRCSSSGTVKFKGKKTPQGTASRSPKKDTPSASPGKKALEKRASSRTDSNLVLLKEVAERLNSKEDVKRKVAASPQMNSSDINLKKSKSSKSSHMTTPERKSSKEDTTADVELRRTPSIQDAKRVYSSKQAKKKSSVMSPKKKSSSESVDLPKDETEAKTKLDISKSDSAQQRVATTEELEAASATLLTKKSSSKRTLPSSLTHVTQIPQTFPPIDSETLSLHSSSRGSVNSNMTSKKNSNKSLNDKLQKIPASEVPRRGSVPSMNRRFSIHVDKHFPGRHQSHGHLHHLGKHETPKATHSAIKSSGHRYHSLRDEPDSCQSFTSIPKHVDSQGIVHAEEEDSLSRNSSVASAPDAVFPQELPLPHKGSKNLLHHLEHSKKHAHGTLPHAEIPKHAESATKSSGHRRHSLRDEPDSCPSFISIPKVVDSRGIVHLEDEENPSGKSSIASAPDRLGATPVASGSNTRTPPRSLTHLKVAEEGTPV